MANGPEQDRMDYYVKRISAMDTERSDFITHYRELSDFIQPRRGRFFISGHNEGTKVHQNIINSTGLQALRTSTSGLLAGTMSPSRKWFDLETPTPDLMEREGVREWLEAVVTTLRAIFNGGNLYSQAPTALAELLLFATGCMLHVDDFDDVARFYTQTAGSYMIGQNNRMEVDTLVREFEWTVQMIVQEFGLENASTFVRNCWDQGNYDKWAKVTHFVEPNVESKARPRFNTEMAFSSVYFEPGNSGPDRKKFLRQSGFQEFPAYAPRWGVTGEDIYGTDCPGMVALGDVKSLHTTEKRKAQGLDKLVNPPLTGPPSIRNVPVNSLPGGLTIYSGGDRQKLESLYTINLPLDQLRVEMDTIEQRVQQAFFVDLFLAISNMEGIQPRNQLDIISRNEEKLLQLGPVLERIHGEFLEPLIERTFNQAARAGILPPPPPALEGQELKVKFISSLALAQRAVITGDIDRFTAFVGSLASLGMEGALDKYDDQNAVDEYGRAVGVPARLVRSDDAVQLIRDQRAQQQAALQQQEQAAQGVEMAKTASETDTGGKNLLTDVTGGNE